MFPFSDSATNPFHYTDQVMFHTTPFLNNNIINYPNSKHQLPSFFFHHHDDGDGDGDDDESGVLQHHHEQLLGHLLQQQQLFMANTTTATTTTTTTTRTEPAVTNCDGPSDVLPNKKKCSLMNEQIPRKRSGNKDRHSKIYTAQGLRDRRMRLSLEIARKFFDLQDMLGFDKASKTIEWLLTKSKTAIKELGRGITKNGDQQGIVVSKGKSILDHHPKERKIRQVPKAAFHPFARESRAKARQRARERTREKMSCLRIDGSKQCSRENHHDLIQFRSSSPFETGEESGNSHSYNMNSSSLEVVVAQEVDECSRELQAPKQDTVDEESFAITRELQPSPIYNYQHSGGIAISQGGSSCNSFPDLVGNWETDGTGKHSSYCDMITNMHLSRGNIQEPIPDSMFLTNSDIRLQSCRISNLW